MLVRIPCFKSVLICKFLLCFGWFTCSGWYAFCVYWCLTMVLDTCKQIQIYCFPKKKRDRDREERKKKKSALEHVYHDFLKEKLFWNTLFLHCFIIRSEEKKYTRACLSWFFERKHVLKCFISSLFYNPFWSFFFFIISWCIMQQCYVCMSYCLV